MNDMKQNIIQTAGPGRESDKLAGTPEISILLIAYACEPDATSEPGVGWHISLELARYAEVCVVTRANNRKLIESAAATLPKELAERLHWIYVDLPGPFIWAKKRLPLGIQAYYTLWQWAAYLAGRRVLDRQRIDLVHHLTFGVVWLAPVACLLPRPFVWGPIGGGDCVPAAIMRREPLRARIQEMFYQALSRVVPTVSPMGWLTRQRAAAIIFRTRSSERHTHRSFHHGRHIMCETASDARLLTRRDLARVGIRAVCSGRMEYWKCFRYAVEGFHEFLKNGGQGKLVVLGDGPQFTVIRDYITRHHLEERIELRGCVSFEEGQKVLDTSNILIHPSFRDGGSWSILEAMSKGLAVICTNTSGPADMIDDTCGIKLNATTPAELRHGVATALLEFQNSPEMLSQMGDAARKRVDIHYRWSQRGKEILSIYHSVLQETRFR